MKNKTIQKYFFWSDKENGIVETDGAIIHLKSGGDISSVAMATYDVIEKTTGLIASVQNRLGFPENPPTAILSTALLSEFLRRNTEASMIGIWALDGDYPVILADIESFQDGRYSIVATINYQKFLEWQKKEMKTARITPDGKTHYLFHDHLLCNHSVTYMLVNESVASCKKCIKIAKQIRG